MAGFFGLFDYAKVGPGVSKNAPKKKRFFLFWELYFRKLSKLISVNLLFLLFCLPSIAVGVLVTIATDNILPAIFIPILASGPPMAGLTYITRNLANEQPIFLFSDFWETIKKNFKQSLAYGIFSGILVCVLVFALLSYIRMLSQGIFMYILLGLCITAAVIFSFMNFYVYLMIVTIDLKLKEILKNAFIFSVLGLKTNLLTLLFTGILTFCFIWFFPVSALVLLPIGFSTISMIVSFNSYQYLQKYIIDPYYQKEKAIKNLSGEAVEEEEEAIFSDTQILPDSDDDEE